MIGTFFECEADKTKEYYRLIQTEKDYSDGKRFPIDEIIIASEKINLNTTDRSKLGGLYVSTYNYVFRWLVRGDTLCKVIIPKDSKIYKTTSENGIYLTEKFILTNPVKVDDNIATKLYEASTLPEISYFKAMAACCLCGYLNTAEKVLDEKVNRHNINSAIEEVENFCHRRANDNTFNDTKAKESVKWLLDELNIKRCNYS